MGEFHGMSSQSYLPHCRVLPPGEFNVMIPELRVTLQGVIIPSPVLKIVFRHILFFNAVWALRSGTAAAFVSYLIHLLYTLYNCNVIFWRN